MYDILEQTTEKQGEIMSVNTDHQMREQMSHDNAVFPITYFHDELASLPIIKDLYTGTLNLKLQPHKMAHWIFR